MVDDGSKSDVVELEAMLKDSFSWHPCQVSLCATGFGLLVTFGDGYSKETISDKEGVLSRVRVRSSPLQGDDCSSIKQGDHVLAIKNSDAEDVYCDAKVEKANRVRHSKRSHCRCSFTIKWLQESHEGEVLTIPASAIMKLARKDISLHPTISAFFDTLDSSNGEGAPFTTDVGDMDWEVDINVLLERQIEEISNSNNVVSKKTSRKCMFGLKVDLNKEYKDMDADVSFKDLCTVTHLGSTLKGLTKENKSAPLLSVQEEFASRSPLNPLAARAALALSRSKLSQGAEQFDVGKGDITRDSGISNGKNAKYEGIVKKLFPIPTPGFTEIADYSHVPSKAQTKGKPKKHKNSEKKIIQSSTTRPTRAFQRNSETSETRETQLMISSKTTRITRATVDVAEKIELRAANEENMSVRRSKSDAHEQNSAAHQSFSITRRVIRSTVDAQVDSWKGSFLVDVVRENSSKRLTRSTAKEEAPSSEIKKSLVKKHTEVDIQNGSSVEDVMENNGSKRRTRSAAIKSKELELEGNLTPESSMLNLESSIHLADATKDSARFTGERQKRRKISSSVETTPNSSESVIGSKQGTKKPGTRFSPRLNSLSQTRSQINA